jgi:hypothetical protein
VGEENPGRPDNRHPHSFSRLSQKPRPQLRRLMT